MAPPSLDWNVVCFSGVDWDDNYQRPQSLMSSLADFGANVLYVDNVGLRAPRLRDLPRVARRMTRWAATSLRSPAAVRPGVRRDAPVVLPLHRWGVGRRAAHRILVHRIRRTLVPGRPLLVWTYLPLPALRDVADTLGADLLVFDWADDASKRIRFASPRHKRRIAEWERRMLESADLVFVSSAELLIRRRPVNPRTFLVPHGAPPPSGTERPAPELAEVPRPRIGFVGTLSELTDVELLSELADARPAWTFVLVGPMRTKARRLVSRPNVLWLGARPHQEIPSLVRAFDVGLIPYRLTAGTAVASPLKLNEYVSAGIPVVSADLAEVRRNAPTARIATGTDGFLRAIEDALRGGRSDPQPLVTWEERAAEMVSRLEPVLAERRGDRGGVGGATPRGAR